MGMKKKKKKKKTFSGVCISYFLTIGQNNEGLTTFFLFVCVSLTDPRVWKDSSRRRRKKEKTRKREREGTSIDPSMAARAFKKGMKGLLGKGGLPGRHTSPRRLATCFLQALVCCSSVVSKFFPLRPGRRDGSQSPHYSTASAILRVLYALDNSAEE